MGAAFEILTPASARGRHLDLGLSKLRNRTTAGRVFLVAERAGEGPPAVFKEVPAPDDANLDARVVAIAASLERVRDPAFVTLYHVGRGASRATLGLLSEYVEGRIGVAPPDPPLRVRTVQRAGVHLLSVLERLHREHGLVHGDLHPGNILVGALDPTGTVLPARVLDLGTGAIGSAIADIGGPSARHVGRRLGETLVCTPSAWGTPGYAPPGRFADGAQVTPAGDLFACVLSLWELLTNTPLFAAPARTSATDPDGIEHHESQMRAMLEDAHLLEGLVRRLAKALPDARSQTLTRWAAFFAQSVTAGIQRLDSLSAPALASELSALEDPYRAEGEPRASTGKTWAGAAPVLERGRTYDAHVVLDYFGGAIDGPEHAEAHRSIHFRHVAMLGEGAMGSVHRVEVLRPGGDVLPAALKISIDDEASNRDAIVREAHVLRAQRYDGIAQFLALIELSGGVLALLMDYQAGDPLDVLLEARKLSPSEATTLGRRLLGTLASLHADPETVDARRPTMAPQVVHGDIKPGNIMVPRDAKGRSDFSAAVLIDFGVARLRSRLAQGAADRPDGQIVGGTIGYMPRGHITLGASPASDVFAVAVVLYESLTLRRPWEVDGADKMSPIGLAFALEERMKKSEPDSLSLQELPPWRKRRGWRRFFQRVLANGDMDRIPPAHQCLGALESVRRDYLFEGSIGVVAVALAALVGVWFQRDYCPSGQTRCDQVCTDLASNARHCGACGVVCGPGEICSSGTCSRGCAPGQTLCDDRCVDLSTDRLHCGACSSACGAGTVCSHGACTLSCAPGLTPCGGSCRDLSSDRAHCGACGRVCPAGEVCGDGRCVTSCTRGLTSCQGVCRDLSTDRAHCGECTRACGGGEVCSSGHCVTTCGRGFTDCSGSCRDLLSDHAHCGACDHACAAGEGCAQGHCVRECGADLAMCEGRCRDFAVDPSHCGACGHACGAGERCSSGRCALSCPPALTACEGQCRDTAIDRANCGGCGHACASGLVCTSGRCALVCPEGLRECGGQCVDDSTDEAHCGRCDNRCPSGVMCVSGQCVHACPDGLSDCGGRCRDTRHDASNCGGCGHGCGDGEACVSGRCRALAVTAPIVPTVTPTLVAPSSAQVGRIVPKL